MGGGALTDRLNIVEGLAAVVPSSSTPDYVSLKNVEALEVVIHVKNATTVTGSAITLKQATSVGAGGEKGLAFSRYYANIDTAASDAMTAATPTNPGESTATFTTNSTNSKNLLYRIPVDLATLDTAGGFDCIRAGTGDATAATVTVLYIMKMKYGGNITLYPSVIVD